MSQEVPGNGFPEGYNRPVEYPPPYYNAYGPYPPAQPQQYAAMPPAPARRRRGRWVVGGILIALLVLAIPTFFVVRYVTRSTPDKTLDAFCMDVQQSDYQSAYDQFSPRLQRTISEASFANILVKDKVSACTHGTTGEDGASITNTMKLVHISKGINSDIVTLTKDSSDTWKIDDISRQ